jgi:H+/Cl- antiporter ClcA
LSLGREGPSIQLGASVADGLGRKLGRSRAEQRILIAAGAGAGLAAAFNAPITGVIFVFEEIFRYLSPATLLTASVSAVLADYLSRAALGNATVFNFQLSNVMALADYWLIVLLGVAVGLGGAFYNYTLIWLQTAYKKCRFFGVFGKLDAASRPVPVFFLACAAGLFFPMILCSGRVIIGELVLSANVNFLLALLVLKFLFSIVSFISGAPGGIFFPLLIIGSLIGAVFGICAIRFTGVDAGFFDNFVVFAMAGFFTGIVRAPITGILLLTEMTGSFAHILPMLTVCVTAYAVAGAAGSPPIYDSLLDAMLAGREPLRGGSGEKIAIETVVQHGSAADGKIIAELDFPPDCLVLSVARDGFDITPHGGTAVRAGDRLTVLCSKEGEPQAREHCAKIFEGL